MRWSEVPLFIASTAATRRDGQKLEVTPPPAIHGARSANIRSNDPFHRMIDHDFSRITYQRVVFLQSFVAPFLIAAPRKHRNRYLFDPSAAWHKDCPR